MNDSNFSNDKAKNLYNKFDMKNFDVKTDGTTVSYKPEYHQSKIHSDVFPLAANNIGGSGGSQAHK